MEIMAEMTEKRSIIHHQVSAEDNFFEEGQQGKEPEAKRTNESLRAAEKAKENSRPNSWKEVAAAAGVTLVEAGEPFEDQALLKKKKKSLKEVRTEQVKRKGSSVKITESEKKMFKEAFNTDKARLEKRHAKYDRPANFLLLVEDNVHQTGPCGAATAEMVMVYGKGKLMEQYLGKGVKHDPELFYIHKNTFDFKKKEVDKDVRSSDPGEAAEEVVPRDTQLSGDASKSAAESQPTKYELYLRDCREVEMEEKRRRRSFDFDSD